MAERDSCEVVELKAHVPSEVLATSLMNMVNRKATRRCDRPRFAGKPAIRLGLRSRQRQRFAEAGGRTGGQVPNALRKRRCAEQSRDVTPRGLRGCSFAGVGHGRR